MEGALNKVGLYDFFGSFLIGMFAIVISYYLEFPFVDLIEYTDNEIVGVVIFLLLSYAIGLLLHEISSVADKWIFKIRENTTSSFLNQNSKIISNNLELKSYQTLANKILNKNANNVIFDKEENLYVFQYCKTYLEVYGKNDKESRVSSQYAMGRSLITLIPICSIIHIFCNIGDLNVKTFLILGIFAVLLLVLYNRTKRMYAYRIRVILRHYKMMKDNKIEST